MKPSLALAVLLINTPSFVCLIVHSKVPRTPSNALPQNLSSLKPQREYLIMIDSGGDGLGAMMMQLLSGFNLAASRGWTVICNPDNFHSRSHQTRKMGWLFGCMDHQHTSGVFASQSFVVGFGISDEEEDLHGTAALSRLHLSGTDVSNVTLADLVASSLASSGNSSSTFSQEDALTTRVSQDVIRNSSARAPVTRKRVHVLDICKVFPDCFPDFSWLAENQIDFHLGVQVLRSQFASALHLWDSPSLESIWGDSEHRLTIHLRRGDLRENQEQLVRAQKVAKGLLHYLQNLGTSAITQTIVNVLSETSAIDPALEPLQQLQSYFPDLRMKWYLGEPETVEEKAQKRIARDLVIMASSTALFMSPSSFSLLGACLQEPTALRFFFTADYHHESASAFLWLQQKLGWDTRGAGPYTSEGLLRLVQNGTTAIKTLNAEWLAP
jgi:hypothetical protein